MQSQGFQASAVSPIGGYLDQTSRRVFRRASMRMAQHTANILGARLVFLGFLIILEGF